MSESNSKNEGGNSIIGAIIPSAIVATLFGVGCGLSYWIGSTPDESLIDFAKKGAMPAFVVLGAVLIAWLGSAFHALNRLENTIGNAYSKITDKPDVEPSSIINNSLLGELVDKASPTNADGINFIPAVLARLTHTNLFKQKISAHHRVVLEQAPALFTGLGILFTFWGLISGLHSLNIVGDSDQTTASMNGLILGVSTAFGSSLVGIMTSLAALLATRIAMGGIETEASKLRAVIERYDRVSSPKEVFSNIRTSSEQTAEATSRGAERIERLIDLNKKQATSLGDLSTDLSSVLQQALTTPLNNLTESIDKMTQGNVDAHTEALETVMEGFTQGIDDRLGKQLQGLGAVLDQTLEWHKTTHKSFADVAARLDNITSKQEEVIGKQHELLEAQLHIDERRHQKMEQTTQALETAGDRIENLTKALIMRDKTLTTLADELSKSIASLEAAIVEIDRERQKAVSEIDSKRQTAEQVMKTIRDGADAWRNELELTKKEYTNLSKSIREELHAGLSDTFKTFDSESAEVVKRLGGSLLEMKDFLESMEESLEQMKSHSGVMVQTLSTLQRLQNQRTTSPPIGE